MVIMTSGAEGGREGGVSVELLALEVLGRAGGLLGPGPHTQPILLAALHTTDLTDRLAAHTLYFSGPGPRRPHPRPARLLRRPPGQGLNLSLRRSVVYCAQPGLGTPVRVVLRLAGEEQARTDLQDTIEMTTRRRRTKPQLVWWGSRPSRGRRS